MSLFHIFLSDHTFVLQHFLFIPPSVCSFGSIKSSINKQPEIFKSGAVLDRAEQIVAPIFANSIMGPGTF